MSDSPQSSWKCFYPTLGIFSGAFLGWVMHFYLKLDATNVAHDLAIRIYDMTFALIGWALGTAAYGMSIHCGGSKKADARTRERSSSLSIILLMLLALATLFLVVIELVLFYIVAILLLVLIFGEIKMAKPFWFVSKEKI